MNTNVLIYGAIGASGVAAGFGVGYVVSKKRHEKIADAEIESVKETYSKAKAATIDKPDLEEVVTNEVREGVVIVEEISAVAGYIEPTAELGEEEQIGRPPQSQNVFEKYGDGNDPVETTVDVEPERPDAATPSETTPYLISIDEWHDGAWDKHAKLNVTYFVGDDILIDEREQIVPNKFEVLGDNFVDLFGQLSLDPEVVYIRNIKLGADFEVTKDNSSYQEQILGLKQS